VGTQQRRIEVHQPGGTVHRFPAEQDFRAMLASAKGADGLEDLRRLVSAWQSVARQCDVAFDEAVRLAVHRLEVERALGDELARTVSRGGRGSKSPTVTSKRGGASNGLPDGVTKQNAKRYRDLAGVPDDVFRSYVEYTRSQKKVPSSNGARRFAASHERAVRSYPQQPNGRANDLALPDPLLAAIGRILVPDVVVGEPRLPGRRHVAGHRSLQPADLEGDVFLGACHDPAKVVPQLERLCANGTVRQAVVVARAEVWADWFGSAIRAGWAFCLVRGVKVAGGGLAVLQLGTGRSTFSLVAAQHGASFEGGAA
jgi:hypothetical protein